MAEPDLDSDPWLVYVLVSAGDGRTYVGITRDLLRRVAQHNGEEPGGAKSTRGGRPWQVARTFGPFLDRGRAQHVEHLVKRQPRHRRLDETFEPE